MFCQTLSAVAYAKHRDTRHLPFIYSSYAHIQNHNTRSKSCFPPRAESGFDIPLLCCSAADMIMSCLEHI